MNRCKVCGDSSGRREFCSSTCLSFASQLELRRELDGEEAAAVWAERNHPNRDVSSLDTEAFYASRE